MRITPLLITLLMLPTGTSRADERATDLPQPSLSIWAEPEVTGPLVEYWQVDLGVDFESVLNRDDWLRLGPFMSTNVGSNCQSCYWDLGVWSEYSLPLSSELEWRLDLYAWQTDYLRSSDWKSEQYGLVSSGLALAPAPFPCWTLELRFEREFLLQSPEPLPTEDRVLFILEFQP